MSDGDATNRLANMSSFASALAVATKQLNSMAARLNGLTAAAGAATFQIQRLSNSAARLPSPSQAVATYCQGRSKSPTVLENSLNWLSGTVKLFFVGGLSVQATKLWVEAVRWIWSIVGPRLNSLRAVIAEMVTPISRAVAELEIFDTIAEAAAALVATLTAPEWARIGALAATAATTFYLPWRNVTAIVRAIRKLCSVVVNEATEFIDTVTSAVSEVIGMSSDLVPRRPDRQGTNPHAAPSRYSFAPENLVSSALIPVLPSLASLVPLESVGVRAANIAVRTAAAAILMTPLLVTPASADIASVQPRIETVRTASVAIHSSPAITINASNCEDIEEAVLAALRKHRDELYAQFCNELQRRQRTEF
jgi:hypothetical protein